MSNGADLRQDLRYGLRSLRRNPGFTVLVVLSLALGIGSNAAIFSIVDAVLLRPLPVKDPERLVLFSDGLEGGYTDAALGAGRVRSYSYPMFDRLRRDSQQQGIFAGLAAAQTTRTRAVVRRAGSAHDPDPGLSADARLASGNLFDVLGLSAWRGRTFGPADETGRGTNPVVVLSHRYWQRRFGGAPDVLGSRLIVNGYAYTVVGILPPGLPGIRMGDPTDIWIPLSMQAELMRGDPLFERHDRWLLVYGRLAPGGSMETGAAAANVSLQRWMAERPDLARVENNVHDQVRIELQPGGEGSSVFRRDAYTPLVVMTAGVALLLLIVCLNVSHLLLARGVSRQREMAIRTALGSSGRRLLRQLLTESLLLAALGAAAGLLTSRLLIDGLAIVAPGPVADATLDVRLLGLIALLAIATAALLGLVPAWHAGRVNVQEVLRAGAASLTGGGPRHRVSRGLLVSQVVISVVLLMGAGLLAGSLRRLQHQDTGFDRQQVLQAQLLLREAGLSRDEALRLYEDLVARVNALPGVEGASLSLGTGYLMRAATWMSDIHFAIGGRPLDALTGTVTPGYFDVLGISLVRGRQFTRMDGPNAPPVAVVNESFARSAFGNVEAALGQRLAYGTDKPKDIQIVGVVEDIRTMRLREAPSLAIYRPVAQAFDYLWSLEVRAHGAPASLADLVRRTVREAHPALSTPNVRTFDDHIDRSLQQERLVATLATGFGVAALFLVCLGLYGVIAQWVGQRTREIGLRMALGATTPGLRWLVLRQAFVLVLVGLAVGLPAALASAQVLEGLLYGIEPIHPPTLALTTLALLLVAAAAAYVPARRASRVNPIEALRAE